ncbi:MAG: hypothetical protein ACRD22_21865 [Terriglobia bacterium]
MAADPSIDVMVDADRQSSSVEQGSRGLQLISEILNREYIPDNLKYWLRQLAKHYAAGERLLEISYEGGLSRRTDTQGMNEWINEILKTMKIISITMDKTVITKEENATSGQNLPDETDDQAQQTMFRDIDSALARLESGIAAERAAIDALLDRLTGRAA